MHGPGLPRNVGAKARSEAQSGWADFSDCARVRPACLLSEILSIRQLGQVEPGETRGEVPDRPRRDRRTAVDPTRTQQDGGSLMKSPIAALAMAGTLVAVANAQSPALGGASVPTNPPGQHALAPDQVFSESPVPKQPKRDEKRSPATPAVKPVPIDQGKEAMNALPPEPIEPLLLTKDVGPFMVLAKTFRGPDAERYAVALVKELRSEFGLPAYILRTSDFANRRLVPNVPPRAPAGLAGANQAEPEKVRNFEECAVLVGNEKTLEGSAKLLHQVKDIKPTCLDALPTRWNNRRYLKNAMKTTNPYSPPQDLLPRKLNKVVDQEKQDPQGRLDAPDGARILLPVFPPIEVKQ